MRSLFVLSLPRSLSTVVYHAARLSLGFPEPAWVTDGEILNADRLAISGTHVHDDTKFVREHRDPVVFGRLSAMLDDIVREEGHAYKDVVNPFVAAAWLREHDLAVLKIRRDLVDVAFSMGARDWWYPCSAAESGASGELALLEGLHRAQQCIDRVPGETIDYDDVVHDEGVLHAALRRLYPGDRLGRAHFIDGGFAVTRDAIVARRESPDFRRLSRLAQSIPDRN